VTLKNLVLLTLLAIAPDLFAATLQESYRGFGELIITQLVSAPFPHPARAQGYKYGTNVFSTEKHYQDSRVAIFIPKNFRKTARVDLVVHFHGWRHHLDNVFSEYQLIEQFVESGRNAILVVPQGPHNAPDSFEGKLEDTYGFKNFIADVVNALPHNQRSQHPQIGRIILSGHSGGYHVMAAILARGGLTEHVREVWLFDALYGDTDKFVHWFQPSQGRLIDIYTAHGGTKGETEKLMASLKTKGTPFLQTKDTDLSEAELRGNRLIFLFSALPHDNVMQERKAFGQFLRTSELAAIEPVRPLKTPKAH
jgi:hypothetical protein